MKSQNAICSAMNILEAEEISKTSSIYQFALYYIDKCFKYLLHIPYKLDKKWQIGNKKEMLRTKPKFVTQSDSLDFIYNNSSIIFDSKYSNNLQADIVFYNAFLNDSH